MTMIEIPRLMPQGRVAVADPQELGAVAAAGDELVAPRRRRHCPSLAAKELLDIPVTYLDPGELLDEAAVLTLASCSFIFTPPKGGGPTSFTPAQKGQLVAIYRSLPYGAKGTWLARQKISSATIWRWGQRLGLPPVSVAKLDAITEDISSRLSPRAMTYLTQMYAVLPYQEKQAFLIALGMTHMEMSKWIAKTADGSIGQ